MVEIYRVLMKIFCTGVSGSGKADYLKESTKWCSEQKREKIRLINIGDLMFETARKLGQEIKEEKYLIYPSLH